MITEKDLQEAIAECKGQRNPNASTCIKLAAFLTIQREMYGHEESIQPVIYSRAESPIEIDSGSEFSDIVRGADHSKVMSVMDELMQTLAVVNPRLYNSVVRKLTD